MALNRPQELGMTCFPPVLFSKAFITVWQTLFLFIYSQDHDLVYVLVYVDDILITGNNPALIQRIIASMGSKFAIKDLGSLHYFLGIEVVNVPTGLILSQTKYAQDLLQRAGMSDCRPCASSSSLKPPALPADSLFTYPDFYRAIVGSFQYLTLTSQILLTL